MPYIYCFKDVRLQFFVLLCNVCMSDYYRFFYDVYYTFSPRKVEKLRIFMAGDA